MTNPDYTPAPAPLPLGIPPLPAPPSRTLAYAAYQYPYPYPYRASAPPAPPAQPALQPYYAQNDWKKYMLSLGTQMGALDVGKPLPPVPSRHYGPSQSGSHNQNQNPYQNPHPPNSSSNHTPNQNPNQRPLSVPVYPGSTGPYSHTQTAAFPPVPPPPVPPRPSAQLRQSRLVSAPTGLQLSTGCLASSSSKPQSKPSPKPNQSPKPNKTATPKSKPRRAKVIDLTADSDSDASYEPSDEEPPRRGLTRITPSGPLRSSVSTPPRTTPSKSSNTLKASSTPRQSKPSPTPSPAPSPGGTLQCAGFTRAGAPCKRTVKAAAPLLTHGGSDDDEPATSGRYCKDHAGLVCASPGFYWRDARGKAGVWIQFDDYIPADLGQQTQTLLRMTMESALTAKELPGFLYAYELRSLSTASTSYYKVGRTDNVPRRIGQWSNQCTSHTPTLRDIFPLKPPSGLVRKPSAPGSLLPGAVRGGVNAARMVPAVKRWERLVHLELADRAASLRGDEYDALAQPCADCGAIHQEIFPLADGAGLAAYENIVVDAIGRWEAFIRAICD